MKGTPKGIRLHIGLYGRRNVGKSSLLNALTGQDVSIVSEIPGTTTDVVKKAMELKPIGPVLFLDTAGLDDVGELGEKRIKKTHKALERTDVAIVITDNEFTDFEREILENLRELETPSILVFNKSDIQEPSDENIDKAKILAKSVVVVSSLTGDGFDELRNALVINAPEDIINTPKILNGLLDSGDVVICVIPIDFEAPKGRLILPQVQVIREVLDDDGRALVVKERDVKNAIELLKEKPKIVITDSQAIVEVAAQVPEDIPVTGFSVLYARWKGDLETFLMGTLSIKNLKPNDKILIAEVCTHHPIEDDIGRVKIPRWLKKYVGGELEFHYTQGHDFPDDLPDYKLIIMCGACMTNRREVLTRILKAKEAGVPIANYGLAIAFSNGVLERILSPFPELQEKARSFI